jgi:hypothetical protein
MGSSASTTFGSLTFFSFFSAIEKYLSPFEELFRPAASEAVRANGLTHAPPPQGAAAAKYACGGVRLLYHTVFTISTKLFEAVSNFCGFCQKLPIPPSGCHGLRRPRQKHLLLFMQEFY